MSDKVIELLNKYIRNSLTATEFLNFDSTTPEFILARGKLPVVDRESSFYGMQWNDNYKNIGNKIKSLAVDLDLSDIKQDEILKKYCSDELQQNCKYDCKQLIHEYIDDVSRNIIVFEIKSQFKEVSDMKNILSYKLMILMNSSMGYVLCGIEFDINLDKDKIVNVFVFLTKKVVL